MQTVLAWLLGAAMALVYLRSGHPLRALLGSAVSGAACLWLVRITSAITGVTLALNGASLFSAAFLGAPGVAALALVRGLWRI
ncbi:MAG: pro-sigmaK processing inhibitor BofA family protein [Oscillospiraceae bacterium]|nr:pro-sigmaK processing inhibitor BofA family protein [Oscillospiraceae bacterium]